VIGPLEILHDHDRGSLPEAHLGRQDVDEGVPIVDDVTEDTSMMPRHVAEGTERARRDELIAPPLEHPGLCRGHVGEGTQKRRLADAGARRCFRSRARLAPARREDAQAAPCVPPSPSRFQDSSAARDTQGVLR
jgi:hypothetical protein